MKEFGKIGRCMIVKALQGEKQKTTEMNMMNRRSSGGDMEERVYNQWKNLEMSETQRGLSCNSLYLCC